MREENIVRNNVRLSSRVSTPTQKMEKNGAAPRRLETDIIALSSECMRFVEGDPMLHSIAEPLEARLGENREIISAISKLRIEMDTEKDRDGDED